MTVTHLIPAPTDTLHMHVADNMNPHFKRAIKAPQIARGLVTVRGVNCKVKLSFVTFSQSTLDFPCSLWCRSSHGNNSTFTSCKHYLWPCSCTLKAVVTAQHRLSTAHQLSPLTFGFLPLILITRPLISSEALVLFLLLYLLSPT